MPKKRQSTFNSKPNYVHPSLASSRPSSSGTSQAGPSNPRSVNERLNQLRREQAPKAGIQQRNELAEGLTQKALHPAVRQILNIPAVAGPRAKTPARLSNGRRIPGPAPPQSWLEKSSDREEAGQDEASECVSRSGKAPAFWPERLPEPRSLVDLTLKTLARNWDWIVEYEQHYLATLPITLKDMLLTYIAVHGPASGIGLETLKVLFKDEDELLGGTGSDELKHLDLTTFIGDRLSLAELTKFTTRPSISKKDDAAVAMESLAISDDVAESWEEAAESGAPQIPQNLNNVRFPCLTHLSLAHPQTSSWAQLLSLSTHLSTLTHLSLAYWPTPTLTPNASTSSISSDHGRVQAGGRHFYSELDNDWQEAANILRRLSQNTYCLRWLDVSGCEWLPALTWGKADRAELIHNLRRDFFPNVEDSWETGKGPCGPSWNGSWRQVSYINCYQGWIPRDVEYVRALPAGLLGCELLGYLRSDEAKKLPESPLKAQESGTQVRRWLEKEMEHRKIAQSIRLTRQASGGPYCEFDYGWSSAGMINQSWWELEEVEPRDNGSAH
ncbi:hypothetical protein IWZ03DRAFT_379541 [Phyllosticta citriasiana]|uniref:Tafazzin n=1 Tax=Phyllosticta citriasiana TaxID=595635 RepID=A0ABR1KKA4_9PEZI